MLPNTLISVRTTRATLKNASAFNACVFLTLLVSTPGVSSKSMLCQVRHKGLSKDGKRFEYKPVSYQLKPISSKKIMMVLDPKKCTTDNECPISVNTAKGLLSYKNSEGCKIGILQRWDILLKGDHLKRSKIELCKIFQITPDVNHRRRIRRLEKEKRVRAQWAQRRRAKQGDILKEPKKGMMSYKESGKEDWIQRVVEIAREGGWITLTPKKIRTSNLSFRSDPNEPGKHIINKRRTEYVECGPKLRFSTKNKTSLQGLDLANVNNILAVTKLPESSKDAVEYFEKWQRLTSQCSDSVKSRPPSSAGEFPPGPSKEPGRNEILRGLPKDQKYTQAEWENYMNTRKFVYTSYDKGRTSYDCLLGESIHEILREVLNAK